MDDDIILTWDQKSNIHDIKDICVGTRCRNNIPLCGDGVIEYYRSKNPSPILQGYLGIKGDSLCSLCESCLSEKNNKCMIKEYLEDKLDTWSRIG